MEGGPSKAGKTEFTECWRTARKTPYIMRLALSAGIGGLLFGYDTGVISGALLYIRDDFNDVNQKTWLQSTIVSMAVGGAILGAAIGGWMNDKYGRKISLLVADVLFTLGAITMALAPSPWVIILGRIFVGFGVGIACMSAPLYISEASPARIRGALVSINGFLITGGQFLSYCINLAFTKVSGTWRWMLGIAALPAVVQFILMLLLPESPRWLYRQNKKEEARAILEKIYPPEEVEEEIAAMQMTVEAEQAEGSLENLSTMAKLMLAFSNKVVRRALYAGVTVQVAQQFSGINTVMYYSPTIVQFAGFASNSVAMALSLVTSSLNAVGSIVSMAFVDRYGRRRLMIISMVGIITCLIVLSIVFFQASSHSPPVGNLESTTFNGGRNSTCPAYLSILDPSSWSCMKCLKAECSFCGTGDQKQAVGACLAKEDFLKETCHAQKKVWYERGCPSRIGFLAVIILGLYIISYSPGMGTAPWIVNSEIYPLRFRGIGGGIAAVANWVSNLLISETFLSMTEVLTPAGAFLVFAGISFLGLAAIFYLVPETKGMTFEEVEKTLQKGYPGGLCRKKCENIENDEIASA